MTSVNNEQKTDVKKNSGGGGSEPAVVVEWGGNFTESEIPSNAETSYSESSRSKVAYRGTTMSGSGSRSEANNSGPAMHAKNNTRMGLTAAIAMQLNSSDSNGTTAQDSKLIQTFSIKNIEPYIEVNVAINENEPAPKLMAISVPEYDHFQPMFANFSKTKNPLEMQECLVRVLQSLVDQGVVDFFEEAPFVYSGRAFGFEDECEYRISIFSDADHKSVIEIRRSMGHAFTFAHAEGRILKLLRAENAIPPRQQSMTPDSSDIGTDSDVAITDSHAPSCSFTFGQLPDMSSLELPDMLPYYYTNEDESVSEAYYEAADMSHGGNGSTDVDVSVNEPSLNLNINVNNNNNNNNNTMDARHFLETATRDDTMQDESRADVAQLKHEMDKNVADFVCIEGIVQTLLNPIIDAKTNFDAFVTLTILQCITLLMNAQVLLPPNFESSLNTIQERWRKVVENKVTEGLTFKFAPSQQVENQCRQILHINNSKYQN